MWQKRSRKILVVDDEAPISRLLARFLTRDGHLVYEAHNAAQALDVFRRHQPLDAIICDLCLGADSGWQVSAEIYALQPSIAILMSTGHLDVGLGPPGLPYSVLRKPFSPSELTVALNSLW